MNGKTVFITGGSRGIGLSIAIALAKRGANVAIAAKTAEPNPKLPGTIYSAARLIEEAGGKALPIQCDIRYEDQVEQAIQKTVDTFGGLDIVINNASAISLTNTSETPIKRFDLMHSINARGTWIVSKLAIPFLLESYKKGRNPHILTLSPPLDLSQHWFTPHVAYSMAKYGMSLATLGLSGELQDQVCVNALWPLTAIETAAAKVFDPMNVTKTRKPEIVSDAALVILQGKETGHFFIDELVLRKQGVTDFSGYKSDPNCPEDELTPDFFLPSKL